MNRDIGIQVQNLTFCYGTKIALNRISLNIPRGEICALLGPNGSGKTTLMRILSTLFPCSPKSVLIDGQDLSFEAAVLREKIGVVFQSPSLDLKLSVTENLKHHGHLYGLSGKKLKERCAEILRRLNLEERSKDQVAHLSGGLQRRVEVAKGLLHRPKFLFLDEPSTGLDPAARADFWQYLFSVRKEEGVTVLVSTHLMEEAQGCDRAFIINAGSVVAEGDPASLCRELGGDVLSIQCTEPQTLAQAIQKKWNIQPLIADGFLQVEHPKGHQFMTQLVETFPGQIHSIMYRKPTLEDVFMHKTGHRFWETLS